MEENFDINEYNLNKIESDIENIKKEYPNIDSDPNSHDGSYELIRAIIMQYREEIYNSSNWGAYDVNALYFATTFVKKDTKIDKISKSNLKNKEIIKKLIINLNKKFQNKEYTNNIDEANDIGMFKNVSGGFGDKTNAKASEEDLRNFIIFCTEIIDENDNNTIYTMFEKNICNKVSDNNMSIGILSQILHCLKPNIFPILNGGGLEFYQKVLNIKMQSKKGKEVQIDSTLKNYIKFINAIKDNTKDWKFNNYRILDIIAQKYYFSFGDIKKYFTVLAGTPSKNRSASEVRKCKAGHGIFTLISKKINKNDFEYDIHRWNNGKTANPYFWTEYKNKEFKDLPYSISFFAEGKNVQFRIDIECKGEDAIFSEWIPDKIIGFDDFGNNTSKLVKIFNGPFEYANSRNTIEQIQKAFSKLEPEYNKLCNMALGKVVPVTESTGESGEGEIMHNFPLNQILYGPPGTGKTYNTVVEAMKIIGLPKIKPEYITELSDDEYKNLQDNISKYSNNYNDKEYKALKQAFDYFKGQHRIEFITFHQSYSYEEFVEGIKPYIPRDNWVAEEDEIDEEDNKDVKYIGKKGIFRQICKRAEEPVIEKAENNIDISEKAKIWKVSLMGTGNNRIREYCMQNNCIRIAFDKYGKMITDETIFDEEGGSRVLNAFINKMDIGDIVLSCFSEKSIDAIGIITGDYEWKDDKEHQDYKRQRSVKWLIKDLDYNILSINQETKFTLATVYQLKKMLLKDIIDIVNNNSSDKIQYTENDKPYVLLIDEINRGNISKIFGELITLIEPDKRLGEEHELKVKLPYSQDEFGVPNNLYIIGTMNTADRSIASVDIALRRRFKFIEMMPKPELLRKENEKDYLINNNGEIEPASLWDVKLAKDDKEPKYRINLQLLLQTLNERISVLLDPDHQIGHSYFLNLIKKDDDGKTLDYILEQDLKDMFKYEILPLLNEYFYDDWEKLKNILIRNDWKTSLDNENQLFDKCFIQMVKVGNWYSQETKEFFKFNPCIEDFKLTLKLIGKGIVEQEK